MMHDTFRLSVQECTLRRMGQAATAGFALFLFPSLPGTASAQPLATERQVGPPEPARGRDVAVSGQVCYGVSLLGYGWDHCTGGRPTAGISKPIMATPYGNVGVAGSITVNENSGPMVCFGPDLSEGFGSFLFAHVSPQACLTVDGPASAAGSPDGVAPTSSSSPSSPPVDWNAFPATDTPETAISSAAPEPGPDINWADTYNPPAEFVVGGDSQTSPAVVAEPPASTESSVPVSIAPPVTEPKPTASSGGNFQVGISQSMQAFYQIVSVQNSRPRPGLGAPLSIPVPSVRPTLGGASNGWAAYPNSGNVPAGTSSNRIRPSAQLVYDENAPRPHANFANSGAKPRPAASFNGVSSNGPGAWTSAIGSSPVTPPKPAVIMAPVISGAGGIPSGSSAMPNVPGYSGTVGAVPKPRPALTPPQFSTPSGSIGSGGNSGRPTVANNGSSSTPRTRPPFANVQGSVASHPRPSTGQPIQSWQNAAAGHPTAGSHRPTVSNPVPAAPNINHVAPVLHPQAAQIHSPRPQMMARPQVLARPQVMPRPQVMHAPRIQTHGGHHRDE